MTLQRSVPDDDRRTNGWPGKVHSTRLPRSMSDTSGMWGADVQFMFGDCVLAPDRRELTRGSEAIAVGPQVFDLLLYLVENRERVISKDALLDAVWDGRIVSESTMTSH